MSSCGPVRKSQPSRIHFRLVLFAADGDGLVTAGKSSPWWWNNQRLHGELDMCTPAEVEADYYAGLDTPLGTLVSQAAR